MRGLRIAIDSFVFLGLRVGKLRFGPYDSQKSALDCGVAQKMLDDFGHSAFRESIQGIDRPSCKGTRSEVKSSKG